MLKALRSQHFSNAVQKSVPRSNELRYGSVSAAFCKAAERRSDNCRRDNMPFDLISGKFIPEKSNIWRDCVDGHYDWVKEHVMEGAPLNASDHCGDPPLLLAAGNGHLACVKLLLEEGADIEQRNVMKESPLSRAAHNGHLQMVQYLVQQGADVNCLDLGENTPLHWAAMRGHVEIVKYLVEQHADRSLRNRHDKIAIDLCQPCWSNSYAYTRAVLEI